MRPGGQQVFAGALILSVLATVASCARARPVEIGAPSCPTWQADIAPLFATRCAACHTGAAPAGHYDTSSYAGVLAGGSDDVPNAAAGDADARLLTTLDPLSADSVHQAVSDVASTVRRWVTACGVSFVQSSIHRGGILDPASPDFHGQLLKAQEYDFAVCQKCHGNDFAGGASRVSCLGCHAEGPTACATCHGTLPRMGVHAAHLGGGPLGKSYGCAQCHVVPSKYTDAGHIFLADGTLDPPGAEVTLGAIAALTPLGATRAGPPAYDPATQSCSNVYCHGGATTDSAASNTRPTWQATTKGQAECGSCHGLPPKHDSSTACVSCHPSVVDRDRQVIATDKHADGKIDFGDPTAGCAGCHGTMANVAPPPELGGGTASAAIGVGASALLHLAHVKATAHLTGPIACGACHLVPTSVLADGHFGGHAVGGGGDESDGAEVFPTGNPGDALARSGGASPRWDRLTATCSNVYCHGNGAALAADSTPGVARAPVWTATGGLGCGSSCHGLPPAIAPHVGTMTRFDCSSCHPRTVDPAGVVIVSGAPGAETSAHINGVTDVAP